MIKLGEKVYHFQTMNRIGTVVGIFSDKSNVMTTGGTTASRVFIKVEYPNGDVVVYNSGDVQKHFD